MQPDKKTNNDSIINKIDFYQSANTGNQIVKRNFVVRIAEFQIIIDDLKSKKDIDPLQHELLLGRRGSGKSTLLKRIQIEMEEDPELSQKYIAINLAEEQAGIYRLFDLWMEVLKELSIKLNFSISLKGYTSFPDGQSYTRYLYGEIHEILKKNRKKVVLLLDNIDRIVENFADDGNLLRETLLNYNDVQIIGGSARMDEHFWSYDKPFYEFFRRHRLEALSTEEAHQLLTHWSELMNLPQLAEFTTNNPGKIESVRILTDGLPRTLQFFIQVLLHDSTLDGFDHIRKVMDSITPLYQERLNHLPAPQRKIVLEMAFLWEACSVKQLAEKCSMESKLVSAQLQKLSNAGLAETITTSKKNHLYRLSERFFNMWLIITQGDPEQKRKAKWLSIFLEIWYDAAQLKTCSLDQETEKYHLRTIEKGHVLALFNLVNLYYCNNKNRKEALQLIRKHNEQRKSIGVEAQKLQVIIEIWNGVFENLEEKTLKIISESNYNALGSFIQELLIQEQTHIVSSLFQDQTHGKALRERYILLYYAILLLTNNNSIDNLKLRIPPEVMPTVTNILDKIKERQLFYQKS